MSNKMDKVDEEKLRTEVEALLEEELKQVEKEWLMYQIEKADAERQAHLRGEYTESDYQKDLALYLEVIKRQKQR